MKKGRVLILALLLLIFLASRTLFFRPSFLESMGSCITYPFIKISSTIASPIKKILRWVKPTCGKKRSYQDLLESYKTIKQERDSLREENITLHNTLKYHEASKDIREFADRYKLKNAILAKVLVKKLTKSEHSILVNRGSRDGIKKDMVAIYKFQLVGRVSKVYPWYSKIILITDRYSKIAAHTNTSEAQGIVVGNNSINTCYLKYISHLKAVHNNDLIFSSGKGLVYPEGFCLGKIANVRTEDLCHHVEVKPLVNLENLKVCYLTNIEKMSLF